MNWVPTGMALEKLKSVDPILRGAFPGMVRRDPSDLSVGTGDFTQGIPAFWFARGVEFGSAENLYAPYSQSAWVRRAIKIISLPIASCELVFSRPTATKVRRRRPGMKQLSTSRGLVYRAPEELLDLPRLGAWLKEPVKELTWSDFVEGSIGWLNLQECFWLMGSSKRPFPEVATPDPVKFARPDRMRPEIVDDEIVSWKYITSGGKTLSLDPDQVVRLRGWNPYDEFRGLGDYKSAHIAAEADWLAGKFSRNLMANNGDTSRVIVVKGGMPDDAQRAQLLQQFKERREQSQRGINRDVVVGGDVELQNAELASVDANFVSQRLENRHEIFIAFGVPPSMADVKASYSIGSASDMFNLLINTCIPTGAKFCGAMERLIQRLTGEQIEVGLNWDEHPCMQEVRKERLDSVAKLAAQGMPMEQINEYLALGLVEFPGWDVGYLPINVQPVLNDAGEVTLPAAPGDFQEPIDDGAPADGGDEPISDGADTPVDGDAPEVKAMLEILRRKSGKRECGKAETRSSQEQKLWESHMRLRSAAVKMYQGKVGKLLAAYRATALKHLAAAHHDKSVTVRSLVDVIFNATQFGQDLRKQLDPVTQTVLQKAGDELMDEIGQPDDPWKMAPAEVKTFLAQRNKLLARVGETVQGQLNTALQAGVDQGETTDQLAGRVKAVFNSLTNAEARRIAMTETSAAYGFSRHHAMKDAGIEYKAWLTSGGGNVRDAHAQAGEDYPPSKPVEISEPFIVDGEELMYPGDESGSPGNVINCHCIQIAVKAPE